MKDFRQEDYKVFEMFDSVGSDIHIKLERNRLFLSVYVERDRAFFDFTAVFDSIVTTRCKSANADSHTSG